MGHYYQGGLMVLQKVLVGMRRRAVNYAAAILIVGASAVPLAVGGSLASAASQFSEYPIPTANSGPGDVAIAADGSAWFVEYSASGSIGKVTPSGTVTEYALPSGSYPHGITAGPDGNMWFTL